MEMGLEKPTIVIAGGGGMGALFGAILQEGGLEVTLLDTSRDHVDAINHHGLRITGFGGDRTVSIEAIGDAAQIGGADLILFQCKGHATRDAARSIRHLVEGGALSISFQNGLGNEEMIGEEIGSENVLGGTTAMAGYMLGPGETRDFSRVPSYIGEMDNGLSKQATMVAKALTDAGLETHASADIRHDIWKKLLGNIALSAASGATNLSVAQCLRIPELKQTSLRALDEAMAVAASQNVQLDRHETLSGLELISQPGGTGDNKSSLCADLLNARPTEVDFIYGTVIARANEAGIRVPTLETLSSIVKGMERHNDGKQNEQI